jgi:hypothetical protein
VTAGPTGTESPLLPTAARTCRSGRSQGCSQQPAQDDEHAFEHEIETDLAAELRADPGFSGDSALAAALLVAAYRTLPSSRSGAGSPETISPTSPRLIVSA